MGVTIHASGDGSPRLVQQVRPVYPPAAKQAGTTGAVGLRVVIGKDGKVKDIQVAKSAGAALDAAAMEAVRQWVYEPTFLNGNPVEVQTTIDVNFTLSY